MDQPPEIPPTSDAPPPVPPRAAPPTMPTGAVPRHESSWPKVLGVLCIVLGGIGLLSRFFQIIASVAMRALPIDAWMKPPAHLVVLLVALGVAGLLISILHLALGVQLVRRKPSVKPLAIAFLLLVVVLLVPGLYVQHEIQQAQVQAMQQHMAQQAQQSKSGTAPPPAAMFGAQMGAQMGAVFGILGGLISLAWPTFLVVWLFVPGNRRVINEWATPGP